LRFVDPDDGAIRYDVSWISPTELVCVSERTGIANLERIDLESGATQALTNVLGAAVAPEPNPVDRSIWFLSLHSRGYDVRRLSDSAMRAAPAHVVAADSNLAPALPPPQRSAMPLSIGAIGATRRYDAFAQSYFWVPTGAGDADGISAGLAIASTDIVGRLAMMAKGTLATEGAWRGGALQVAWRGWRPGVEASGYWARQLPSLADARTPITDSLDATLAGGSLATGITLFGSGWNETLRLGGDVAQFQQLATSDMSTRATFFGRSTTRAGATNGDGQFVSGYLTLQGATGTLGGAGFSRGLATLGLATGYPSAVAIEAAARYGRITDNAPVFEQFALGGLASPIVDDDELSQRIAEPALPTGAAVGAEVVGFRVALAAPITPYVSATRVSSPGVPGQWFRVYGAEFAMSTAPIPVLRTPGGKVLVGVARARDDTGYWRVQAYAGVFVEP